MSSPSSARWPAIPSRSSAAAPPSPPAARSRNQSAPSAATTGAVAASTDPNGNGNSTSVNLAGQTIESVTGGSSPQTILNTYDGDGDLLTTTNVNPGSVNQTTAYLYAAGGTVGTNIFANNLNTTVEFPDPTTGVASASSAKRRELRLQLRRPAATYTDRNGTQHSYSYDVLGREIADSVTPSRRQPRKTSTPAS